MPRLPAEGLPDAQIAARLCLSPYAVRAHLRSVYARLGASSRGAATRFPLQHRLG